MKTGCKRFCLFVITKNICLKNKKKENINNMIIGCI